MLLSLVFAFTVAEIGLRILIPPRTKHFVWPPGSFHTFKPRRDIFPNTSPETHFSISSLGLRGKELGKDGSETRVLALGGSTTECLMQDDTKTWPARLGDLLTASSGRPAWVGNAGFSGMSSGDHVLQAQVLLSELPHMDSVLVFLGVNDVGVTLGKPEDYLPMPEELNEEDHEKAIRRVFQQVPGRLETTWDYNSSVLRRSQVFQLYKRFKRRKSKDLDSFQLAQDDSGSAILRWRENRQKAAHVVNELPDLTTPLATFRSNLQTIVKVVKKHDAKLVFLTQPVLWRSDLSEADQKRLWMGGIGDFMREPGHDYYSVAALAEAMHRFNAVTLEVCRETGTLCIDLAAKIPADTTVFYDDCHFGEAGSEKIAQAVHADIAKEVPFLPK